MDGNRLQSVHAKLETCRDWIDNALKDYTPNPSTAWDKYGRPLGSWIPGDEDPPGGELVACDGCDVGEWMYRGFTIYETEII